LGAEYGLRLLEEDLHVFGAFRSPPQSRELGRLRPRAGARSALKIRDFDGARLQVGLYCQYKVARNQAGTRSMPRLRKVIASKVAAKSAIAKRVGSKRVGPKKVVAKADGLTKFQRFRRRQANKGMKLLRIWVPDPSSPEFAAEAGRQANLLRGRPEEKEALEFIETAFEWPDR
jgi:hypothetical protein